MGGGDLNTKKSWHPSTLKNQERVWKAEQAAAEEKKRILELQREREQENDRAQLNEMAQRNFGAGVSNQVGDNRLHWMYDKPDKQVQHEDYLLGKEIGKSDEFEKSQNAIPAVSRRVVGSSMTKSLDDTQVDLARKLREDPLLLVKERERAARAALLNNPLQRKRLADLLRKEKEQKVSKDEVKTKKSKKKDKNLDDILAAKLNALGEKKIDLSSLLNSNDSSSESSQSSDEKSKKKKKKSEKKIKKQPKKTKKKKKVSDSDEQSLDDKNDVSNKASPDNDMYQSIPKYPSYYSRTFESTSYDDKRTDHKSTRNRDSDDKYNKKSEKSRESSSNKYRSTESRKRRSDSYSENDAKTNKNAVSSDSNRNDGDARYKQRDSGGRDRTFVASKRLEGRERRQGMSEADRAAKLSEMAAAGREREVERGERVAKQRAADAAGAGERGSGQQRALRNEARALPDSLESRIRSNRHYIQRDQMHMNQHFARR